MGPRAGLDGRKSRPHQDSIPDRPAITAGPTNLMYIYMCVCMHFILCFKVVCLNACGRSVLPKHVACDEKTNKICCVLCGSSANFNSGLVIKDEICCWDFQRPW